MVWNCCSPRVTDDAILGGQAARHRARVVDELVTHIGSGSARETTAGLQILSRLVEGDVAAVRAFQNNIKGVLDYVYTQVL